MNWILNWIIFRQNSNIEVDQIGYRPPLGLIVSTRNFSLGFRCTTCFGWDADDDAVDGCWKPQSSIDLWNENTNCLKLQSSEKLLLGCTTLSHKCNILPISSKTILNPTTINQTTTEKITTTKQSSIQQQSIQQQQNDNGNNHSNKTLLNLTHLQLV